MTELWEQVDALDRGGAFADRSTWRKLRVAGPDARRWLGDLLTADVASLEAGPARRSLLLTPTGRIRADVWMAAQADDAFLLVQDVDQPDPIDGLLAPYVLSSAVELEDVTERLGLLVLAQPQELFAVPPDERAAARRRLLARSYVEVGDDAFEAWRVARGDPRMVLDYPAGALPAEASLERLIDVTKGCFLGQESVAKIRNLGHPPTVLRHLRTASIVERDAPVIARVGGDEVGVVTSVAPRRDGGSVLLARVAWRAAGAALRTGDGSALVPVDD